MDYALTPYDAIYHYGVKGMRWGIRRTPAQLGHKITKLKRTNEKLRSKSIGKLNTKAAKFEKKAAKYNFKAVKKEAHATSNSDLKKAQKYRFKQAKFDLKSAKFKQRAAKTEKKIFENERVIRTFSTTLDKMNAGTIQKGESFFENFFMKYYDED